jgi:hypothetical protein
VAIAEKAPQHQCAKCGSKTRLEWAWIYDKDDDAYYCCTWCVMAAYKERDGNMEGP